ncbi:MAG: hypothetical protein JW701_01970, partial [Kosmotogaceae bacterium]|nr:hypothetical protein [Kosmotogaceae bacterium]
LRGKEPIFAYEKTLYVVKSSCKLSVPSCKLRRSLRQQTGVPLSSLVRAANLSILSFSLMNDLAK